MRFLFLVLILIPPASFAGVFFDEQVKPLAERATDKTSLHILLGGAASTAWARGEDIHVQNDWRNNHLMSSTLSDVGDKSQAYGLGVLIAGGQWIWDHENGVSHARALISSSLATWTLKYTVARERPNQANNLSFPSGHTSSAFATATALSYAYGWKAAVIAFPFAAFVGASRLADNEHWFSDVVAGATLGIYFGRASYFQAESKQASHFVWMPLAQNGVAGLQVVGEF